MTAQLPRRPFTSRGHRNNVFQHDISNHLNCGQGSLPSRRTRSSHLLTRHPRDFKNVETFNLNPGYRLSKSAGKIYVSISTKDPPPRPEPPPRKLNTAEMESLITDLREQVSCLSTYLEEERLRHGGTRKRANIDLSHQEQDLRAKHEHDINRIHVTHREEKINLFERHENKIKEINQKHEKQIDGMRTEYRMLQASFKNYRSTLQEEMQDQWKLKRQEYEWEMKRAVENAVDDCTRMMEEKFSLEREELRKEFRQNVNEMMRDHKREMEDIIRKFTSGSSDLKELKERSLQLDVVQQELEDLKNRFQDERSIARKSKTELQDTKLKLTSLELQFDAKVSAVEDQHQSMIDTLKLEKADVKRQLARSCGELQTEKIARELAEKERKEAALKSLEAKIEAAEQKKLKIDTDSGAHVKDVDVQHEEAVDDEVSRITDGLDHTVSHNDSPSSHSSQCSDSEVMLDEAVPSEHATNSKVKKRVRVSTAPTTRHPMYFSPHSLQTNDAQNAMTQSTSQTILKPATSGTQRTISEPQPTISSNQQDRPDSPDIIY